LDKEAFLLAIKEFISWKQDQIPGLEVMLQMDRLDCHFTVQVTTQLTSALIYPMWPPGGTTAFLQPLDSIAFGNLAKTIDKFREKCWERGESVILRTVQSEVSCLCNQCFTPAVIKSSFAKTGICPWNPELICSLAKEATGNKDLESNVNMNLLSPITSLLQQHFQPQAPEAVAWVANHRSQQTQKRLVFSGDQLRVWQTEKDNAAQSKISATAAKEADKAKAHEEKRAAQIDKQEANLAKFEEKQKKNLGLPEEKRVICEYAQTCNFCRSMPNKNSNWWCCPCQDYTVCKACHKLFHAEVGEHLDKCANKFKPNCLVGV
jgi:hypothetical protein